MVKSLVERVEKGSLLTRAQAESIMDELLSDRLDTPEIVRLLAALNTRPYQLEEVVGFARAMRRHAAPVFPEGEDRPKNMVDTCGTGGDSTKMLNVSTAAAIVASAAGARVAKHGNRRSDGAGSGSADVLEALGVRIDAPVEYAGRAIREIGFGFLFARSAHTAARHAAPARKQIGARTVFNLLGPLTNPAGAQNQVMGVFSKEIIELMAAALAELGVERAFVVRGAGGIGEFSLAGETLVAEVNKGTIQHYAVTPEDFGVSHAPLDSLISGTAADNAARIRRIFGGESGPACDIVVVNAAAALVAADRAKNFREGARLAGEAISSGAADKKLAALVEFTRHG
jgi:anthranilate phosphoribosyltransferase